MLASVLRASSLALLVGSSIGAAARAEDVNRPDLQAIVAEAPSEMASVIDRYLADLGAVERKSAVEVSPASVARMRLFREGWLAALDAIDFDRLSSPAKIDWLLLRNRIRRAERQAELDGIAYAAIEPLLPEPAGMIELIEARERTPPMAAHEVAERLQRIAASARAADERLRKSLGDPATRPTPSLCRKALLHLQSLRRELASAYRFRDGYDPDFTWWAQAPWTEASTALDDFERLLREEGVGQTAATPDVIVGTPIGRDGLIADLAFEWIDYTPEELLAIAEREFAWCEGEFRKAAAEMGCGDDWKKALEAVKTRYVEPGKQPEMIRVLAEQAVAFLRAHDLVTVPALAEETWRMEMMSPARQLVTPFFTGGEVISIAFPTEGMTHEQKLMTLRGNNIHFAHATVFHELIPGHHLQQYAQSRYRTYRGPFSTPFWTEGWALHWEMLLWDRGFQISPEDRIGALFWRAHRAARIVFSLKYHLGQMSAQECVDYLVERVGHERANAEGEVRRAVSGDYAPLYQVAYMIGGLQFRALHRELVGGGRMSDRAFHDAVLKEGNIPVEFVRMILRGEPLTRDRAPSWRFDEELHPPSATATTAEPTKAGTR